MYAKWFKRLLDILLSFFALAVLAPFLVLFTLIGALVMKGNPFFTQERPGKDEKIFKLIKFRTMTCATDKDGNLLPDDQRLTAYGRFLRSTSIDELPELINIFIGDMSIIGPRPLLVQYLPLYDEQQRRRHEVRPGLSGLAQVNGRNTATWQQKFSYDVQYVDNITFIGDVKIVLQTVVNVLKRDGITQEGQATTTVFTGNESQVTTNE